LVHQFLTVFDDCYSVPIVKSSQKTARTAKITIGVPIVTGLSRLYQQCTNRQKQSTTVKNSQKNSQNSKKMTIGVPVVTGLPRLYQQCIKSVPIVKNSQKQSKDSQNSK